MSQAAMNVNPSAPAPVAVVRPSAGPGIASLVLGILGTIVSIIGLLGAMGWTALVESQDLVGASDAVWSAARESSMSVFMWFAIGAGLSVIALILGIKGRKRGIGIAGLVISIIGTLLSVATIAGFTDAVTFGL